MARYISMYGLSLYIYVVVVHTWSFDEDYRMVVETFGS